MPHHPDSKGYFPSITSKPPLSLKSLPLVLSLQALVNSPSPSCRLPSGTGRLLRYWITPKPSLFQAEQPQISQPFLIGEVLHPSYQLGGLLALHPQLHVLPVLGTPDLDAALQVGSHLSGAESLPSQDAAHSALDAAQDMVGCWAVSTHVQPLLHHHPKSLSALLAICPSLGLG